VTDRDLIGKKLAGIETAVREIQTLGHPRAIYEDVVQQRFFERTLQIAIQAVLDVASHIVSDERLGEPQTNRDLIDLLARHGWVPPDLAETLGDMVGFRNILVHGYDSVDLTVIETVADEHLGDFDRFVRAIRARLATPPP
jgi:uncharacterized protein YutE (UPF0331/DUF86 family)